MSAVSVVKSFRPKKFLAIFSAFIVLVGMLLGARVAVADEVWVQSYQRGSASEACKAQSGETPWQASWGTDSSWTPSWEQWANAGRGGWTCTRSITWARTPVASIGSGSGGGGSSPATYALGDIGPGGGLVFLISGGLTYEMAPNTWSAGGVNETTRGEWCSDLTNSVATGTVVGTGSANTTAMLTNATPFVACTSSAPNAVRAYAGGGLTDWFLPSKGELNAMYIYSTDPGFNSVTYGFAGDYYWSSSQLDTESAWGQSFINGNQGDDYKDGSMRVRPVRAF